MWTDPVTVIFTWEGAAAVFVAGLAAFVVAALKF
jgi:hypothetical protein